MALRLACWSSDRQAVQVGLCPEQGHHVVWLVKTFDSTQRFDNIFGPAEGEGIDEISVCIQRFVFPLLH